MPREVAARFKNFGCHVHGIVLHASAPKQTSSGEWHSALTITDDSAIALAAPAALGAESGSDDVAALAGAVPAGGAAAAAALPEARSSLSELVINVFAPNVDALPRITHVGQVVRVCHVQPDFYRGTPSFTARIGAAATTAAAAASATATTAAPAVSSAAGGPLPLSSGAAGHQPAVGPAGPARRASSVLVWNRPISTASLDLAVTIVKAQRDTIRAVPASGASAASSASSSSSTAATAPHDALARSRVSGIHSGVCKQYGALPPAHPAWPVAWQAAPVCAWEVVKAAHLQRVAAAYARTHAVFKAQMHYTTTLEELAARVAAAASGGMGSSNNAYADAIACIAGVEWRAPVAPAGAASARVGGGLLAKVFVWDGTGASDPLPPHLVRAVSAAVDNTSGGASAAGAGGIDLSNTTRALCLPPLASATVASLGMAAAAPQAACGAAAAPPVRLCPTGALAVVEVYSPFICNALREMARASFIAQHSMEELQALAARVVVEDDDDGAAAAASSAVPPVGAGGDERRRLLAAVDTAIAECHPFRSPLRGSWLRVRNARVLTQRATSSWADIIPLPAAEAAAFVAETVVHTFLPAAPPSSTSSAAAGSGCGGGGGVPQGRLCFAVDASSGLLLVLPVPRRASDPAVTTAIGGATDTAAIDLDCYGSTGTDYWTWQLRGSRDVRLAAAAYVRAGLGRLQQHTSAIAVADCAALLSSEEPAVGVLRAAVESLERDAAGARASAATTSAAPAATAAAASGKAGASASSSSAANGTDTGGGARVNVITAIQADLLVAAVADPSERRAAAGGGSGGDDAEADETDDVLIPATSAPIVPITRLLSGPPDLLYRVRGCVVAFDPMPVHSWSRRILRAPPPGHDAAEAFDDGAAMYLPASAGVTRRLPADRTHLFFFRLTLAPPAPVPVPGPAPAAGGAAASSSSSSSAAAAATGTPATPLVHVYAIGVDAEALLPGVPPCDLRANPAACAVIKRLLAAYMADGAIFDAMVQKYRVAPAGAASGDGSGDGEDDGCRYRVYATHMVPPRR